MDTTVMDTTVMDTTVMDETDILRNLIDIVKEMNIRLERIEHNICICEEKKTFEY